MANWIIRQEDLDEVYPPRPIFPFREVEMFPEQVAFLNQRIVASLLVNGGPGTGKTVLAIMRAMHLSREGKNVIYIAQTSLTSKYVKHVFHSLGMSEQTCMTYHVFDKQKSLYDVALLDDSHCYTMEQIQSVASKSNCLLLFGDYVRFSKFNTETATIRDIVQSIHCEVFELNQPCCIPGDFLKLASLGRGSISFHSTRRSELPIVAEIAPFDEQCRMVRHIVQMRSLEDVGILCYTRALVRDAYTILNSPDFHTEVYLPGKEDGLDTLNLDSGLPKILTIASSVGIHFKTVFVLGFDKKTIWNNPEDALVIITTRATENLFIFYEGQLPEPLASVPQDLYRSSVINDAPFDF